MSWADLQAMLANASSEPAFIVAGALMVLIGGIALGAMARRRYIDNWPDTGDTQAPMIASAWMPPKPTTSTPPPAPQLSEWPERRVRMPPYPSQPTAVMHNGERRRVCALGDAAGAKLKPSYTSPEQRVQP